MIELHMGECLEVMASLPPLSVDMICCDLPYGTTYAKWDSIIPLASLWGQYERLIKGNGAIVLTASQPFTSMLVASNPTMFRCEWIWNKVHGANFANANKQPLKIHESVLVFAKGQPPYNPIKSPGPVNHTQGKSKKNVSETRLISGRVEDDTSGMKFPQSIQCFPKHSSQCGLHPTQKPVPLMEYFIRTYSKEGDLVLDNCMGSGTTGVAALQCGRSFIGIESDPSHFQTAKYRIEGVAR